MLSQTRLRLERFGDTTKGVESILAIRRENAGKEIVKALASKFILSLDRRIKISIAGKMAFDDFFVGHALENSHNGGVGVPTFEFGQNFGWFEG